MEPDRLEFANEPHSHTCKLYKADHTVKYADLADRIK